MRRRRDPGLRHFERIARRVLVSLPDKFLPYLENLTVDVQEEPGPEDLAIDGVEGGDGSDELFGIFHGVPLTEQSFGERHPNQIKVFRGPLLRYCRTRGELKRQIEKTLLHELAHHFGYSEDDLDDFEALP